LLELWKLSLDFDPNCGRRFDAFATAVLRRRLVDWQRKTFGRTTWKFRDHTYTRKRPEFVEFNDPSEIDLTRLSRRGQAILLQVATRIGERYSTSEVAAQLNTSSSSISRLLRELRDELGRAGRGSR
jgi:DNA-directed RNA polymerase specialized sigma subunit